MTGQYERVVLTNDPMVRFSADILLDLTEPADSALLLAPLAKAAGGLQSCGVVFTNTADPDYKTMLAAVRRAKTVADAEPRYSTPKFQPNRQYVREMKKYGVLPATADPAREPVNFFETDQRYWSSFWVKAR